MQMILQDHFSAPLPLQTPPTSSSSLTVSPPDSTEKKEAPADETSCQFVCEGPEPPQPATLEIGTSPPAPTQITGMRISIKAFNDVIKYRMATVPVIVLLLQNWIESAEIYSKGDLVERLALLRLCSEDDPENLAIEVTLLPSWPPAKINTNGNKPLNLEQAYIQQEESFLPVRPYRYSP